MATTYYFSNTAWNGGTGGTVNLDLVPSFGVPVTGTVSLSSIAASATQTIRFFAPVNAPSTYGATGNYTIYVTLGATTNTSVRLTAKVYRVNSAGTVQSGPVSSSETTSAAANTTYTLTITGANLGTWASGDRLMVEIAVRNSSTMSSVTTQQVTISATANTGACNAPWTLTYSEQVAMRSSVSGGNVTSGGVVYKDLTNLSGTATASGTYTDDTAGTPTNSSDPLYLTEWWGPDFTLNFTVPNGTYAIQHHCHEGFFTTTGQRIYSVTAEGTTYISNLDMYAANAQNTIIRYTGGIAVSDGTLNVRIFSSVENANFNAIRIVKVVPPTVTATASPSFNSFTHSASATVSAATTTGTAAQTFNSFTHSASGSEVLGTSSASFNSFTHSASGVHGTQSTSAAQTLSSFTNTASGVHGVQSTSAAQTFNSFTHSASATHSIAATAAQTLSTFTHSATAVYTISGTSAQTFNSFTHSASGSEVVGSSARTFNSFTHSASAAHSIGASAAQTFNSFTHSASATHSVGAAASQTFNNFNSSRTFGIFGWSTVLDNNDFSTNYDFITLEGDATASLVSGQFVLTSGTLGFGSDSAYHTWWGDYAPGTWVLVSAHGRNISADSASIHLYDTDTWTGPSDSTTSTNLVYLQVLGQIPSNGNLWTEMTTGSVSGQQVAFDSYKVELIFTSQFVATASQSLNSFTHSASATHTVSSVNGSAAQSFTNFVHSASGSEVVGSSSVSFSSFTHSASGAPYRTGNAAQTFSSFTHSASGSEVVGTATPSFNSFTQSASGTWSMPAVTGSAAQTFNSFGQSSSVLHGEQGSAAQTFSGFVHSASGSEVVGTSARTFNTFTASASATTAIQIAALRASVSGGNVTDTDGTLYKDLTSLAGTVSVTGTYTDDTTNPATDKPGNALYMTEWWGPDFTVNFTVPSGYYIVEFICHEGYFTLTGQRVFSVSVEGTTVISNLDMYATAGNNSIVRYFTHIPVTDGTLNVRIFSSVENANFNAIRILKEVPSTVTGSAAQTLNSFTQSSSGTSSLLSGSAAQTFNSFTHSASGAPVVAGTAVQSTGTVSGLYAEDGSAFLAEDGSAFLSETTATADSLTGEDGSAFLAEDGTTFYAEASSTAVDTGFYQSATGSWAQAAGSANQNIPFIHSASGYQIVPATAAQTVTFTHSATGTPIRISTGAVQIVPPFIQSASGQHWYGLASQTFNNFSHTGTAVYSIAATAAQTFNVFNHYATVFHTLQGSAAQTTPPFYQSANGGQLFGSAAQTFNRFNQSASGSQLISGTAAQTLNNFYQISFGYRPVIGTGSPTLVLTGKATGVHYWGSGIATQTFSLTQIATGKHGTQSTSAAQTFPIPTQIANGVRIETGSGSSAFNSFSQTAQGAHGEQGSAAQTFLFLASANGESGVQGTATQSVTILQVAQGHRWVLGTGSATVLFVQNALGEREILPYNQVPDPERTVSALAEDRTIERPAEIRTLKPEAEIRYVSALAEIRKVG